jgi:hypothetical protein
VNLLCDNVDTIKKNTETLTDASEEVGLEANAVKTTYMSMLMSGHLNEGHNYDMKTANTFYEKVANKYFVTTVTNQNLIHEEFKS